MRGGTISFREAPSAKEPAPAAAEPGARTSRGRGLSARSLARLAVAALAAVAWGTHAAAAPPDTHAEPGLPPGIRAEAGLSGASAVPAAQARGPFRFAGEFGLYVRVVEDGLDVRWLSETFHDGVVRAWVDDRLAAEASTPASDRHAVHLAVTAPVVVLEYGTAGQEPLYRTTIARDAPAAADLDPPAPDSVYLFGDVHGEFDRIVALLRGAELIDEGLAWRGGTRSVVFLGDLFDRGDDVTRVLWFLYGLERQAAAVGGRVHVVLGNHEVMVMSGDLRYVSGKEKIIADLHGVGYQELFHPRHSVLGRWLASKPGLVRMDDLLLAHGGVSPTYLGYSLTEFQDTLRAYMDEPLFTGWNDTTFLAEFVENTPLDSAAVARRWGFFFGSESVLWFRDLVLADTLGTFLDDVLDRFDARVHIVGHTPVPTIRELYDGKLIAVDLRDAASEMLLLAKREEGGWERIKIPLEGPPQPLATGG